MGLLLILFWFDEWSSLERLIEITNARGCISLGVDLNATMEFAVQNYRSRRHRAEHLMATDAEIIWLRMQRLTAEDDVQLWKCKGDVYRPEFLTQQTWRLLRVQQPITQWYKKIWFTGETPKYSVMSWIAAHNRLATGDRILQLNPQANANCIFCNSGVESHNHLFFSCSYSEKIWRNLAGRLMGRNYTCIWDEVLYLISTNIGSRTKLFLLRCVFQVAIHMIWMERNGRRHGTVQRPPGILVKFIDKQTRNIISSLRGKGGKHLTRAMAAWFEKRE